MYLKEIEQPLSRLHVQVVLIKLTLIQYFTSHLFSLNNMLIHFKFPPKTPYILEHSSISLKLNIPDNSERSQLWKKLSSVTERKVKKKNYLLCCMLTIHLRNFDACSTYVRYFCFKPETRIFIFFWRQETDFSDK